MLLLVLNILLIVSICDSKRDSRTSSLFKYVAHYMRNDSNFLLLRKLLSRSEISLYNSNVSLCK